MPKLTILNPRVAERTAHTPIAPELAALRDMKIAFVDNSKVNADLFLSRVRSLLEQKYGVRAGLTVRKLAPKDELSAADVRELGARRGYPVLRRLRHVDFDYGRRWREARAHGCAYRDCHQHGFFSRCKTAGGGTRNVGASDH